MLVLPALILNRYNRTAIEMPAPPVPLLHYGEPIDPTLWTWLIEKIDNVLGLPAGVVIAILGVLIVSFPIIVVVVAVRRRRGMGR